MCQGQRESYSSRVGPQSHAPGGSEGWKPKIKACAPGPASEPETELVPEGHPRLPSSPGRAGLGTWSARDLTPNCRFPEARSRGRSQDSPCERRRRKLFLEIRVERPAGFPGWEGQFDGPGAAKEHCLELEREGGTVGKLQPCLPSRNGVQSGGGRKLRKHPYSP